jgi:hypothetical protein
MAEEQDQTLINEISYLEFYILYPLSVSFRVI